MTRWGSQNRVLRAIVVVLSCLIAALVLGAWCYPNTAATFPSTPQCSVTSGDSTGLLFILSVPKSGPYVPWSDVTIVLSSESSTSTRSWEWHPTKEALSGYSFGPPTQSIEASGLVCEVTDAAGNGYVDSGDFFTIEPNSTVFDFDPSTLHELELVYEPSSDSMWTGEFHDGVLQRPHEFPWMLPGLAGVAGVVVIVAILFIRNRKKKNGMDSIAREDRPPKKPARASLILLGITLVFWLITNHWIAEDRRLFEFPHESVLLATVVALTVSIAFSAYGRVRLSRLCLGVGAVSLVVAVVLWYGLMIGSYQ